MPTKILLFTNTSLIGGAERNALDLANYLKSKGFQIYIAALEGGGPLLQFAKEKGIHTFDPGFQKYYNISYIKRIFTFLKKNEFNIILVYGLKLKIVLIPIAFLLKKPIIFSMILGLDIWKNSVHLLIEKLLEPFTSHWISNSYAVKRNAIEKEGKPDKLVHVIYNGLPISQFKPVIHKKIRDEKFKVITIANIHEDKGHFIFLRAIHEIIDKDTDIYFEFIGNDYTNGKIKEEIVRLDLEKHVKLPGYISDVRLYIHDFDLMVLPSFAESLPTSIIECMLEGVPVLSTNVGGIPKLIDHKKTGWLVEPGDEKDLVQLIFEIKENYSKRLKVAQNAKKFASQRFDIKKIGKQYEFLFNRYLLKTNKMHLIHKIIRVHSRIVVGGPAKHTILLSKNLNNKNYRTVLVGGTSKAIEKSLVENARTQGIDCVIIPEMAREIHFYDDLISLIKLFRLIKKEKPHIFHSHTAKAGGIGRLAAYVAGVPIIFHTFHGHVFSGYFGNVKTRFFIYIERLLALISTKVIVISERQKNDIINNYRIANKKKVELIRLGFDWKEKFLVESNFSLRNQYHIPKDKYLIGIIGRLVPIKDHRLFIEIAEKLILESGNNYHFIIIGDGELKSELIQVVKEKKIQNYFTFSGWIEVNKCIYDELDILLLTSLNEGTPVTVIESLAAGTPVIARDVGGIADVMKHYKLEYLVKERNPAKFIELINKIRVNSDKPLKITQDKIMGIYSSERLVSDIKSLYERSLKNLFKSNSEIAV